VGHRKTRLVSIRPGADSRLKKVFATIGKPAPRPFQPDPFQLEAVAAVEHSDCLVSAPTGAGKT
jgi:superfamily II RNA helicase